MCLFCRLLFYFSPNHTLIEYTCSIKKSNWMAQLVYLKCWLGLQTPVHGYIGRKLVPCANHLLQLVHCNNSWRESAYKLIILAAHGPEELRLPILSKSTTKNLQWIVKNDFILLCPSFCHELLQRTSCNASLEWMSLLLVMVVDLERLNWYERRYFSIKIFAWHDEILHVDLNTTLSWWEMY